MGKVLDMVTNRVSSGREAGARPEGGGWPKESPSDEPIDRLVQSRPASEPQGGLPSSAIGLGPLGALAASAAVETDIPKLLQSAAQTVVETLRLGHVLIWIPEYPYTPTPNYAAAGWNAKQQGRLVRRLAKKSAGGELAGWAVPASSPSSHTEVYRLFETGLLKKQGVDLCLVAVGGSGLSRVVILADRREVPDARKAQVTRFFGALVGVLGLALARAGKEHETSTVEAQVRRAKIQWEDAADSLHQLVCVIDRSGHVLRANRTLEAWGLG